MRKRSRSGAAARPTRAAAQAPRSLSSIERKILEIDIGYLKDKIKQVLSLRNAAYDRNDNESFIALRNRAEELAQELAEKEALLENGKATDDLPELSRHAVIKDSNKATERRMPPRFEHPEPDRQSELEAIHERSSELAHVSRTVGALGLEGADIRVQITGLNELAKHCEDLARRIGMHAVSEGTMTQRELSRLLGVHELTVHRWVKAAQETETTSTRIPEPEPTRHQ